MPHLTSSFEPICSKSTVDRFRVCGGKLKPQGCRNWADQHTVVFGRLSATLRREAFTGIANVAAAIVIVIARQQTTACGNLPVTPSGELVSTDATGFPISAANFVVGGNDRTCGEGIVALMVMVTRTCHSMAGDGNDRRAPKRQSTELGAER